MAKKFVSKPKYPGGVKALQQFIAGALKYPETARKGGVAGKVTVRYTVDYRGRVVDAFVKKGIGSGCDEEALRVVKLLKFDVPQDRKKKVRIHQDLTIRFELPKELAQDSPAAPPLKITYQTVTAKPDTVSDSSYNYTIRW